jgi:hypothetical protein
MFRRQESVWIEPGSLAPPQFFRRQENMGGERCQMIGSYVQIWLMVCAIHHNSVSIEVQLKNGPENER